MTIQLLMVLYVCGLFLIVCFGIVLHSRFPDKTMKEKWDGLQRQTDAEWEARKEYNRRQTRINAVINAMAEGEIIVKSKKTWKCKYCGMINDENDKLCVYCGSPRRGLKL